MFVIPAIAVFLVFVYLRPHELTEVARPLTVNLVAGLVAFGFLLDVGIARLRLRLTALHFAIVGLFVWYLLTVAIKAPDRLGEQVGLFGISLIGFVGVSAGFQSLRGLGAVAGMLLAFTLLLSALGVHQSTRPTSCFVVNGAIAAAGPEDLLDGRVCAKRTDCEEEGLPGRDYLCEHPGLLNTHSIGKRVRFRGLLEDPNELAWAIAMGTPLAFALYERRRSKARLILVLATLVLGFVCVVKTQSRSGQLSMVAMMGVYFLRRFGVRGAVGAAVLAIPMMMLGGRSGAEAESSSEERLECWSEALSMWRDNPFLGVGGGQFLEHHNLTAHSSFMLTLAELGPVGLLLWSIAMYMAFKIPLRVQTDLAGREDAADARVWATAVLSMLMALLVSAFFLSIAYHTILWTFLGLTAALYGAVQSHAPEFRVRFGWRDLAVIVGGDFALVAGIAVYLRLKGV